MPVPPVLLRITLLSIPNQIFKLYLYLPVYISPFVRASPASPSLLYLSCCCCSENVLALQLVITRHHIPNL